jgi:hypothetical protein
MEQVTEFLKAVEGVLFTMAVLVAAISGLVRLLKEKQKTQPTTPKEEPSGKQESDQSVKAGAV